MDQNQSAGGSDRRTRRRYGLRANDVALCSILTTCFVLIVNLYSYTLQQQSHHSEFSQILEQSRGVSSPTRSQVVLETVDSKAKFLVHAIENHSEEASASLKNTKEGIHTASDSEILPKHAPRDQNKDGLDQTNTKQKEALEDISFEERLQQNQNLTGYNILLLYADDWSHHTLSSYHNTQPLNSILKTPSLDKLASEGIRFSHNCVTTSVCWISRATLYTGQYLSRHNTSRLCCWGGMQKSSHKVDTPLSWKELSFYEILADHGYHVGHVGKWGVALNFDKKVHYNIEGECTSNHRVFLSGISLAHHIASHHA
jgi:hypothetical protein